MTQNTDHMGRCGFYEATRDFNPVYFVNDSRVHARSYVNESADSYFAREAQRVMLRNETYRLWHATRTWKQAADNRRLYRKSALNAVL